MVWCIRAFQNRFQRVVVTLFYRHRAVVTSTEHLVSHWPIRSILRTWKEYVEDFKTDSNSWPTLAFVLRLLAELRLRWISGWRITRVQTAVASSDCEPIGESRIAFSIKWNLPGAVFHKFQEKSVKAILVNASFDIAFQDISGSCTFSYFSSLSTKFSCMRPFPRIDNIRFPIGRGYFWLYFRRESWIELLNWNVKKLLHNLRMGRSWSDIRLLRTNTTLELIHNEGLRMAYVSG